jgi:hypothetical protein
MALRPMPIQVPIFDTVSGLIAEIWRTWFRDAATAIGVSAPVDAPYLTATADPTLTAPRNLGLLTSGYLKVAVALGIATPSSVAAIPQADVTGLVAALAAHTAAIAANTAAILALDTAVAYAALPAAPSEGMVRGVTNSTTAVWGAVIAGGGANHVLAYYNGTAWIVAAA